MVAPSVLVVCGAGYVSGKEIMALELARGLVANGHRVTFVTSSWSDGDFQARLKSDGLNAAVLPIGFISATMTWPCIRMTAEQLLRWPGLLLGYAGLLRRERPSQVVHTNWHHLILLYPFLRPNRDSFWLHEVVPGSSRYGRLFRRLAQRLNCFICVSQAVGSSLLALDVEGEKVVVVPNGISDPAGEMSLHHDEASLRRFGPLRVGIVGQVGRWKGHDDLLDAASLLAREGLDFRVEIIGGGDEQYRLELKERARRLGLEKFVQWRGVIRSKCDIYSGLDICVVPSRFAEPFGLAALEPAFFEIPVVATNRGGLPEIVVDRQTGLLVDAENPVQLAAALRELINDRDLRTALGRAGRRRAIGCFGIGRFAGKFSELLIAFADQTMSGQTKLSGSP